MSIILSVCRYYGCGLVIPQQLQGMSLLDLGSGAGQDCFVLSRLVGESGSVTGVDMTDEQVRDFFILKIVFFVREF